MIAVVGGVYQERCIQPRWDQLFGSAGRAAAALSAVTPVELHTYADSQSLRELDALMRSFGRVVTETAEIERTIGFDYVHPLSVPHISPPPHLLLPIDPLSVESDVVLRFGMMEGDAVVRGKRVIYDPQSAYAPALFGSNGSSADSLAIVANAYEVRSLTGEQDPLEGGRRLLRDDGAEAVVVKSGGRGARVVTAYGDWTVPAYRSELVFSIGSGDVFAAAFAYFWGMESLSPDVAADLASRSTALYCESRSPEILPRSDLEKLEFSPVSFSGGTVYLAGPFFTLGERWLVEEARAHLREMGLDVFSPVHDIGPGPADVVAPADLGGLEKCDRVLALLDGTDPGTLFEVGYARARGLPVVALAESLTEEQLKMIAGSKCAHTDDFATAVYLTAWAE